MIIREGTYDLNIIKEQKSAYGLIDFNNKIVMDVGGNIGAFADFAFNNGAKKVVSYEPELDNFSLLVKNNNREGFVAINAALGSINGDCSLFLNKGMNKGIHSLCISRGRDEQKCKMLSFLEQVAIVSPEVIKIDIEGGEYDLFDYSKNIDSCVKQIALEIHLTKKDWRSEKAPKLIDYIKSNNFNIKREPKLEGKNWTTYLIGERS